MSDGSFFFSCDREGRRKRTKSGCYRDACLIYARCTDTNSPTTTTPYTSTTHTYRELCGCVDGDEDDVGRGDLCINVIGEEEVLAPGLHHHLLQARLIDGELVRVPGLDLLHGNVHHRYADARAILGNDSHGGATDIACDECGVCACECLYVCIYVGCQAIEALGKGGCRTCIHIDLCKTDSPAPMHTIRTSHSDAMLACLVWGLVVCCCG